MKWYASAVYIYQLNLVLHERWVEEKISFFFGFLSDFSARSNMIGLEDRCVESTVFLEMAKINVRVGNSPKWVIFFPEAKSLR